MAGPQSSNSSVVEDRSPSITGKAYGRNIRKISNPINSEETQAKAPSFPGNANPNPIIPFQDTSTAVNEHVVSKSRPVYICFCSYK